MVEPGRWQHPWRRALALVGIALPLALAGCSLFTGEDARVVEEGAEPATETPTPIHYQVTIEGVDDAELAALLQGASEAVRLVDRPPSSLARLRARVEADRPRLVDALRSKGFYAATVSAAIDRDSTPRQVTFEVEPGPVYRLAEVTIEAVPEGADLPLPAPAEIGLEIGAPAEAAAILAAEAELLTRARAAAYALAEPGRRRAVVDHDRRVMELTLRIEPGPQVRFGAIEVEGLTSVEVDAVRRRLPWREGEPITAEQLDEGRKALRESGLFNDIRFQLEGPADADGRLPVKVILNERKHRSIGIAGRYRTDEGPGGRISWTHRNFYGRGERLRVELDASRIAALLTGSFRKPDVWRRNLALVGRGRFAYRDTDAFESRSAGAAIGLERTFAEYKTLTGGISYEFEDVDEKSGDENDDTFGLISLPVRLDWDTSDDRLDPIEGGRLVVENEPFVDTLGEDLQFNRSRVDYAHYFLLLDQPELVLAGRVAVGTLFGAARDEVPATKRFYAGGGGSIRGYGFQLAGELDDDDNPLGGRSLLEFSGEIRFRFTETLGAVAFVDAGTTYSASVPDLSEALRVGIGPGFRYFSPIGPFRVDLGFPVDPRDSDDAFQLYISLGQAF